MGQSPQIALRLLRQALVERLAPDSRGRHTLGINRIKEVGRAIALCQSFNGALEFQVGHWSEAEEALQLLPVAVSVRIAQGDLGAAEAYCQQLDEATTCYGSHTLVALAAQARAELAAAQGDIETAVTHYTTAQSGFQEAKNEYAAAQCTEALARLRS